MSIVKGTGDYEVKEYSIEQGELSGDWTSSVSDGDVTTTTSGISGESTDGGDMFAYIDNGLTEGKRYRFEFDTISENGDGQISVKYLSGTDTLIDINGDNLNNIGHHIVEGTQSYTGGGQSRIQIHYGSPSIGDTFEIDNIKVTEIPPLPQFKSGTKYLENTLDGTIALQSNTAYGTWEFSIYKKSDSFPKIQFISDSNSNREGSNGYYFTVNNNERAALVRYNSGTYSVPLSTDDNYISKNTWYRIKITRTVDGEFTLYIKGGEFGDTYQLVEADTGTNPVTDNTYTESNYFVTDLGSGDAITNIKIKDGVEK